MSSFDFSSYRHLVDFLAGCLGEDTEVVLYSFEDLNRAVIAVANGHVGGHRIGDPLTGFAVAKLKDKGKEGPPYYLNHLSRSKTGMPLRSSSLFLLDRHGNPMGLLSVNTDVTRYRQAAAVLQKLATLPDETAAAQSDGEDDRYPATPRELIDDIILAVSQDAGIPTDRLSVAEKMDVVRRLQAEGFFLLKGAVSQVAGLLSVSEATVYRYLSKIGREATS